MKSKNLVRELIYLYNYGKNCDYNRNIFSIMVNQYFKLTVFIWDAPVDLKNYKPISKYKYYKVK